jgi:hypothetical protein
MTDHSGDFEEDEKVEEKSEVDEEEAAESESDEEEAAEEESDEEEEEEDSGGAPEKTAAELRIAYSKLNKLLTVANQGRHHESILKSITDNKRGEWAPLWLEWPWWLAESPRRRRRAARCTRGGGQRPPSLLVSRARNAPNHHNSASTASHRLRVPQRSADQLATRYARRRLLPLLFSCCAVAFLLHFRCHSVAFPCSPEVRRSVALRERQKANRERNCASGDVQGGAGRKGGARTMREMLWPTKKHRDGSGAGDGENCLQWWAPLALAMGAPPPPSAAFARVAQPSRPLELTQRSLSSQESQGGGGGGGGCHPAKPKALPMEAPLELP